ncbi:MAG: class I SAM-dependent methyltransferase [Chromatiales bacterium]|nr:class I SAM-dependent methyltransferase [Chromatiales bacterium]
MASKQRTGRTVFDADYYQRFYHDPRTRAGTVEEAQLRGRFLASYVRYIELSVRRIAEFGCGLGDLLGTLKEEFPRARVTGVEVSEHLCETLGWTRGSVVDFSARAPFDLTVCYDVIQYLPDREAEAALENLARLTQGALFLGVLTKEDWLYYCDQERTDPEVFLRTTRWYRTRLAQWFTNVGGGLWLRQPERATVWSLDRVP